MKADHVVLLSSHWRTHTHNIKACGKNAWYWWCHTVSRVLYFGTRKCTHARTSDVSTCLLYVHVIEILFTLNVSSFIHSLSYSFVEKSRCRKSLFLNSIQSYNTDIPKLHSLNSFVWQGEAEFLWGVLILITSLFVGVQVECWVHSV